MSRAPKAAARLRSPASRPSVDRALVGLLLLFLVLQCALTWRRWPDLLIDYGRELYVPWRISQGAVLYRDILHYYGPLGVHVNALLMRLFGPGYSVVFLANIAMLGVFTAGLFHLLRCLWDRVAAALAVFLFLAAFAFGNYVTIGNYNFVSPYSHDTVYGLYLVVAALAALWGFLRTGSLRHIAAAGAACGGAYLTKPEIAVAALAVAGGALMASVWMTLRGGDRPPLETPAPALWRLARAWVVWTACALVPVAAFNLWFVLRIPGAEGWLSIHSAWVAAFGTDALRESLTNLTFMGMDDPARNLRQLAVGSAGALVAVGGLAGLARLAIRLGRDRSRHLALALGALVAWAALLAAYFFRNGLQVGRALVLAAAFLVIYRAIRFLRCSGTVDERARLAAAALWSVLGASLLLKMLLNPRIEHYGFFQAMPATLDLALFLAGDLARTGMPVGRVALVLRWSTGVLVLVVALGLWGRARGVWALKTYTVAGGRDAIRTYSERFSPMGPVVEGLRREILLNHPDARSLVVFPEGVSLNYLFRLPSPIRPFEFVPPTLALYGQSKLLGDLDRTPPDLIILITRDIREFGSPVFGYDDASGRPLLQWMERRYVVRARVGGNPLQPGQAGAFLLVRKPSPGADGS